LNDHQRRYIIIGLDAITTHANWETKMAKHKEETTTNSNPETPPPAVTLGPVAAVSVADERYVTLVTDGNYGTTAGASVKRIDLIRALWQQQKMSRGAIAKYLSTISGKKIPYQIVFSGTKGLPGGPDKVSPVPVTSAPAA
jgi:hypothetical protein